MLVAFRENRKGGGGEEKKEGEFRRADVRTGSRRAGKEAYSGGMMRAGGSR